MTLKEMKKKVLGMIEELNPNNALLTDDVDISTKINDVINQVMFEVARMKKMPDYVEIEVKAGDLVRFEDIADATGYEVYQLNTVSGIDYELKADGTIIKVLADGTAEIDYFKYPESITEKTADSYEFELSADALEIIPYGVAGDLLKSDVSASYGQIYSNRYETMLQRLDPRYSMGTFSIEGGIDV
jgi:hypothetical protein